MDPIYDRLCNIQPGREAWRIKVRIVRLWAVPSFVNPARNNSLEMVLVDEEGGRIHASVGRSLIYIFENKLVEGCVYKMCFFTVVTCSGYYRTTSHEHKLIFQMKTKVTQTESLTIPRYGLSLVNTDDVYKHKVESEYLVDVIGLLTAVSGEKEYIRDGKVAKMLVIELTDHRGRVECTLFGDYAEELSNFMRRGPGEMPIVIVQFARIKIFKGNTVLQNVMKTSRLLIDAAIPEVTEFRNSLALHGVEADQPVGFIGDGPNAPKEDEFLKLYPKKTISELHRSAEDGIFVVCAKIEGLVEGGDWWYPACRCHRAVVPDCGLYYCGGCYRHVIQVIPRFRVNLDVCDGIETAIFLLFDNDVRWLTRKSCIDVVSLMKLGPAGSYPKELEVMVGKELLFKVEKKTDVGPFLNVSYCVKKVCDDDNLIRMFHAEGRDLTPGKAVFQPPFTDAVKLDDDEDPVLGSQSSDFVSRVIISPDSVGEGSCSQRLDVGPVKRKLVDVFDDYEDLSDAVPSKEVKFEK